MSLSSLAEELEILNEPRQKKSKDDDLKKDPKKALKGLIALVPINFLGKPAAPTATKVQGKKDEVPEEKKVERPVPKYSN
jgi:hypothetical protein